MLKLREPIKTCLNPDLLASADNFCERIRGNYTYMGSELNETELMHLTTQPPEVYLLGGGASNLVSNANIENNQIKKVNIINNLINRILISADAKLSYQDRVYISSVLHQLGIRDERKFMKEVRRLTTQTRQLNETSELYWDNLEELRNMITEYAGDMHLELRSENEILKSDVLHLHETVNRRLKTAAIYQIMRNFYENQESVRNISNSEFRISEQGRFAREVLLNRLRETVRLEAQPLIYKHDNIYEGDETEINAMNTTQINQRVSSAMLMNLIDNIYELSYNRIDHHVRNWLSTEDTFYGSADNVLYRLESNTAYLQYLHEEYVNNLDRVENYTEEISSIRQLLDLTKDIDISMRQDLENFRTDIGNVTQYHNEPADIIYKSSSEYSEGDTYITDIEGNREERLYTDSRYREGDTFISSQNSDSRININVENRGIAAGIQNAGREELPQAELTHVTNIDESSGDTIVDARSQELVSADINNTGISTQIKEELHYSEYQDTSVNISQSTQQNVSPVELTHISVEGDKDLHTEISEENRKISESLYQTYQQNIARNNRYMQNLKNIIANNPAEASPLSPAQRTMQAATQALTDQKTVIEDYIEAESKEKERLNTIRLESEKLLHPLQQKAHELIREYLSAPERFYMSESRSADNTNILIHDIYMAQRAEAGKEAENIPAGYPAGDEREEGSAAAEYPVSSAAVSVIPYAGSGIYVPDTASGDFYESLNLTNIYPVFNNIEEIHEERITVEQIAEDVQKRAEAIREAAADEERSREIVENIYRMDNRSEREFVSLTHREDQINTSEVIRTSQSSTVSRLLENVINRWARRQLESNPAKPYYQEETLSFVHKSVENSVDEETIEDIRKEMQRIEQTKRTESVNTLNNVHESNTVVNNYTNTTIEENNDEIRRLVRNSMREQLDTITERVYGRIEKQLRNEQRRRGL